MISTFIAANLLQIVCGGTFLAGFSTYQFIKLKHTPKNKKRRIQYCDVSSVIKQYKALDKTMNESIGGNKNEKFFK